MMRTAYNRALGRKLTDPVNIAEPLDTQDPGSVDELTRMACAGRPEIAALSAQAQAFRAQAAEVRAKRAPQIAVSGGFLYQSDNYVDPNGIAGVALTAEWNVFDAGRSSHQTTALSQKSEALVRMRKDAESTIALEVRQRWLEVQTAKDRLEFARKATAQADENLRVVRDRYLQGLGTNTEVLDAETLRAQAYMNLYDRLLCLHPGRIAGPPGGGQFMSQFAADLLPAKAKELSRSTADFRQARKIFAGGLTEAQRRRDWLCRARCPPKD